jgi:anti-repressor protein
MLPYNSISIVAYLSKKINIILKGISKMQNLSTFKSKEFGTLQVVIISGKEYFPASDCARILGYKNPRKAIIDHCKGVTKRDTLTNGGMQEISFIPEGDLYRLIIKSKLPSAERFERWVFDEVLPQIRQTGGYIPTKSNDSDVDIMARAVLIANKTIQDKDNIISELQPKAEAYDTFLHTDGYISLNKTAKSLKVGRNKMMSTLRNKKILFKEGDDNIPYQRYVASSYFAVNHITGRDGNLHSVTRVSPKGVEYIHKIIKHNTSTQEESTI